MKPIVPTAKTFSIGLIGILFVIAGLNHFAQPNVYVSIMPPYLPVHLTLVYLSGIFEILGGAGVLVTRVRRFAGWGLIALLLAVFPANLHMFFHADNYPTIPSWALFLRLPLQFALIAWVHWACCTPTRVSR